MLETIHRDIKRAMGKSKLSQLKPIKKRLIKNTKIWGKNILTLNELKKLVKSLQADAKSVLFTEENTNDQLFKKIKKSKYEKCIQFVNLFDRNVNFLEDEKSTISIEITFVEKEI